LLDFGQIFGLSWNASFIRKIRYAKLRAYLCLKEKREGTWSLREMGSTRVGGMEEGPALQAGNKISS
jgi:hypothetical protein